MGESTTLEVWSDIACPWCWIGHARLAEALAELEAEHAVTVVWRSFELDPTAPDASGTNIFEHLASKYGRGEDATRGMVDQVVRTAGAHGLTYRPDIQQIGNTFRAHQLVKLADELGHGQATMERLWTGYFGEGRLMSDVDELVAMAADVGLDADTVRGRLGGEDLAEAVRADEQLASALGITAVPCFVVDRQRAVAGAQPPEVLLQLIRGAPVG